MGTSRPHARSGPSSPRRPFMAVLAAALLAAAAFAPRPAAAAGEPCWGSIVNLLTDICWKCVFPISIGPLKVSFGMEDAGDQPPAVCVCPVPGPPWIRIGLGVGFWEPARVAEVVRAPFCSPTLGGIKLAPFGKAGSHRSPGDEKDSFYQVHWFVYPLLAWMNVLTDVTCIKPEGFDLLYATELDPLWNDDELAFLLNPGAVLFTSPIAQAACAGDCAAATAGFPLDALFWCAGCQGSMYPLGGSSHTHKGGVSTSVLEVQRMAAKLHRMLVARNTSTIPAMCFGLPDPIIRKSQYKTQMLYPIPINFTAHPFGRTTAIYEAGREFPFKGEDWAYVIWRKHLCCAF